MNLKIPAKYIRISLLLSVVISLMIHFSLMAEFFLKGRPGHHEEELSLIFVTFEFLTSVVLAFIIFGVNFFFFAPYDIHKKLNFRKITGAVLTTALMTALLIFLFIHLKD